MCLGIPGQLIELTDEHEHLARIEVNGVGRTVNIALLDGEELRPGDWVLVHVGFAMARLDEHEAQQALEALRFLGEMDQAGPRTVAGPKPAPGPDRPRRSPEPPVGTSGP